MIENYCINPVELRVLLPPTLPMPTLENDIQVFLDDWIQNGALWQTLYNHGAFRFCRGHEQGYPMALLHEPVITTDEIKAQFEVWYSQLDSLIILLA